MYLEERISDRKALWKERCKPKISNLDVELDHPLSDVFARRRFAVERERAAFELVVKLRRMTRFGFPGGPLSSISMYPFSLPILRKLLISVAHPRTYRNERE